MTPFSTERVSLGRPAHKGRVDIQYIYIYIVYVYNIQYYTCMYTDVQHVYNTIHGEFKYMYLYIILINIHVHVYKHVLISV